MEIIETAAPKQLSSAAKAKPKKAAKLILNKHALAAATDREQIARTKSEV